MSGKKTISFVLVIFVFLILQVVISEKIALGGIKPDFFLILLVFFALRKDLKFALVLGFILGLLRDIFSGGILGISAFGFGLCGLIIGKYARFVYKEGIFSQLIIVFCSGIFVALAYYLVSLFTALPVSKDLFKVIILPASVYTAVIALPVFWLLRRLFTLCG